MIAIFPEIAACAASGDVERLAVLVRKYFGGKDTYAPKPDIEGLIRAAGLSLKQVAMASVGALVGTDSRGKFQVTAITTDRDDVQAQRFLLAHLLGHFLLDVTPVIARGDWQQSGYKEEICPHQRYIGGNSQAPLSPEAKVEERADRFAAALLLPQGMVRRALSALGNGERVAQFFGVSRGCLARRLEDLGMTTATPANFLAAERQIGVEEPVAAPSARPLDELVNMPRSYAASTYGATERRTAPLAGKMATRSAATVSAPGSQTERLAGAEAPMPPGGAGSTPAPRGGSSSSQGPRGTARPSSSPATAKPAAVDAAPEEPQDQPPVSPKGMERLRQLARQLDKGERS